MLGRIDMQIDRGAILLPAERRPDLALATGIVHLDGAEGSRHFRRQIRRDLGGELLRLLGGDIRQVDPYAMLHSQVVAEARENVQPRAPRVTSPYRDGYLSPGTRIVLPTTASK